MGVKLNEKVLNTTLSSLHDRYDCIKLFEHYTSSAQKFFILKIIIDLRRLEEDLFNGQYKSICMKFCGRNIII